jgi:transcriptional regulator with XRE-family HTH domain
MRGGAGRRNLRSRLAGSTRRLRAAQGWTQEEAAEKAKLNPRHYQKIERGEVNVTLGTIAQLCRAFGVDVPDLFEQR